MDKVIISAAITGSSPNRDNNPNLPMTQDEVVDAALSCWRAGAAIIHLHARTAQGAPTIDAGCYQVIMERVRAAGCDVVFSISTGDVGGRVSLEDRMALLDLEPEMASLLCGSLNLGEKRVYVNPYEFIARMARRMSEIGCTTELEIFDAGMLASARRLVDEGMIRRTAAWQFGLGSPGAAPADVGTMAYCISRVPSGAPWFLLGRDANQIRMNLVALALGGHIRTGFEENAYYLPGQLAASNAQLVERTVRLAAEVGRAVASADDARRILGTRRAPGSPRAAGARGDNAWE
ncbi:MAG: 3-keto-5-aminohexanoate cleavage protein [Burkholderiales bacterium]|nr:3-keto-5-aminohexanoate cleavage protein [Burkholderiales bacterium]